MIQDEQSRVQFEEIRDPSSFVSRERSEVIRWIVKYSGGLIRTKVQAVCVVLVFIAIIIGISAFLTINSTHNKNLRTDPMPSAI